MPKSVARRLASLCIVGAWLGACSSSSPSGGSGDASGCTGTPPAICDGCCGAKYAADACVDGTWTCQPLGVACPVCGADAAADAPADAPTSDDAAEDASGCPGTPPDICDGCCGAKYAANSCVNGTWTCRPLGIACPVCDPDAAVDASADAATDAPADGDAADGASGCAGTPPDICDGCCGAKYAANSCVNGTWTCRPLGIACAICDAGLSGGG